MLLPRRQITAFLYTISSNKRASSAIITRMSSTKSSSSDADNLLLPSLIVFDLDDCLWTPEMHGLSGLPEIPVHGDLDDKSTKGVVGLKVARYNDMVELHPGARKVLHELATNPIYKDVQLATASTSLEPSYSYACLDGIEILPGVVVGMCVCVCVLYSPLFVYSSTFFLFLSILITTHNCIICCLCRRYDEVCYFLSFLTFVSIIFAY